MNKIICLVQIFVLHLYHKDLDMKLRIGEKMKEKGYSVDQLADKCGFGRTSVFSYVNGNNSIAYERLYKIAEVLGCQVMELIEAPKGFTHVYTSQGLWLGIQREIK